LGGGPRHPCATIEYDVPTQLIYIGIKYEQPLGTVEYFILYCSDFSTKNIENNRNPDLMQGHAGIYL
jgi:hypothetical protein